jgi:hypothetical protein
MALLVLDLDVVTVIRVNDAGSGRVWVPVRWGWCPPTPRRTADIQLEDPVFHDDGTCPELDHMDADNLVIRRKCHICGESD